MNLREWLPEVLLNYVPCIVDKNTYKAKYNSSQDIENGQYAIMLVNAIQYQCSLGKETKYYRDAVFDEMWKEEDGDEQSLKVRLEKINPDIIINCCTKGRYTEEEETIRARVQKVISDNSKCFLLRAAHPSSLYFKNGLSWVDKEED